MLQASKQVNGLQHAGVQVGYFEHIVFHAVHDIKTSHSLISTSHDQLFMWFQWYHEEYLMGRDLKLVEPIRCVCDEHQQ